MPPASYMSVATKRPPGLRLATIGVRSATRSKSSSVELDAELARDRDQVQHAVRRAARGGHAGGGVLERGARDQLRGPQVAPHDVHHEAPRGDRGVGLALVRRRDAGER